MEIKFNNVSLIIDKGTPLEKTLIKDVSFDIKDSGIYAFLGNSNSGKTSCAELIDALVKPTKGTVTIGSYINGKRRIKNVNKLRFNVGYVFKNPYDMFFNKTVKKEITFGMKYFKYKYDKSKLRAIDSLKLVGLDESYLKKKVDDLSLGEARKVALASVLVFNPKIVILDEPTIGLNWKEKKELIRLLKLIRDKYNRVVIILSKDTDFLYQFVDYVYIFDKASLVMQGGIGLFKEFDLFEMLGLKIPDILKFKKISKDIKNKKIGDHRDIKDLIKEVCRDVF